MWDLPGPGLEPVSPALADGFLTTAPPGKSLSPIKKRTTFNKKSKDFLKSVHFSALPKSALGHLASIWYLSGKQDFWEPQPGPGPHSQYFTVPFALTIKTQPQVTEAVVRGGGPAGGLLSPLMTHR